MNLEEAINELRQRIEMLNRHIKNYEESTCKTKIYLQLVREKKAIEMVLQALDKEKYFNKIHEYHMKYNFIPKKKIKDKVEEMKNYEYWSADREELITELQELLEDK